MKGTRPVEVRAEFFTGEPFGRMCDKSCPTPPRRFISCTCSSSMRMMAPYESVFQPLLSDLCHDYALSPVSGSLSVSASTIGMAVGLFVLAFKADAVSRGRLMGWSLIVSSLLTLLSVFAFNYPLLLLVNFLKGAVLAGVSAVALAYLTEEVDARVIGLAISLYLSGNTLGGMVGRVSGTLLAGWAGWHAAVLVIGVVSLLLGLIFVRLLPVSQNFRPASVPVKVRLGQMARLLGGRSFVGVYFIVALLMGCDFSEYQFSPSYGFAADIGVKNGYSYIPGLPNNRVMVILGKLSILGYYRKECGK